MPSTTLSGREKYTYSKMQKRLGSGANGKQAAHAVPIDHHDLAGLDVTHEVGPQDVQRASLGGEEPGAVELPQHEGTHTQGIAAAQDAVVEQCDQRPGALDLAQARRRRDRRCPGAGCGRSGG